MELHKVGPNYHVLRKSKWVQAEILEVSKVDEGWHEYYVHYANTDARLDEWVTSERIKNDSPEKPVSTSGEVFGISISEAVKQRQQKKKEMEKLKREMNVMDQEIPVEAPNVKILKKIQFGIFEIDTWYSSKYPEKYGQAKHLYICEFCCKYMLHEHSYRHHLGACQVLNPPGKQIYLKDDVSVWEIDGGKDKLFCQNLSLLGKLFIEDKDLVYTVHHFYYYVICERKGNNPRNISLRVRYDYTTRVNVENRAIKKLLVVETTSNCALDVRRSGSDSIPNIYIVIAEIRNEFIIEIA